MTRLKRILASGRFLVDVPGDSEKHVLGQIANLVARELSEFDVQTIFESLMTREKFGSIGLDSGIAIPHCRLSNCQNPINAVLHLDASVDFDALNGTPVDLLFILLIPGAATEEHLELLRQIAIMFDHAGVYDRLRDIPVTEAPYQIVIDVQDGQ